MTDLTQDLEKIILRAGIDGALTEDAVAQFHALVTERNAIRIELDQSIDARDALRNERDEARQIRDVLQAECETWAGKEQDLMDREGKCAELEIRKECAELRVIDHKEMFTTVFRNSVLRKEVMTALDSTPPTEYNSCPPGGMAQKDTVEEEET
jgi:hypothetical protein